MYKDQNDENFLARWINGELSKEELEDFKNHPDYKTYQKIKVATDALDTRAFDEEAALRSIKSKKEKPVKKLNPIVKWYPYVAVAASLAILFALLFFNPTETFETSYGEKLTVTLPDGSEMILNATSKASFNADNWNENRVVDLSGEAYFKVKKGSKFTVETENGQVWVLGTQFTVQSLNDFFEVSCFEGKVRVEDAKHKRILTQGMAYRTINTNSEDWTFEEEEPTWIDNTTSLRSVPFTFVIKKLEQQYGITVNTTAVNINKTYTGTFPNTDKEVALNTVFSTLGVAYSISEDGKTVILEK
ncbi:FecR family protein [Aquimarina brevivitae]|uniref:FecR family protein n=1 Tax=Aquimarina brevivitae TaxID=323412 RepID=A0A4Q7P0D8_9FLAO|nr:FecR family protein [Aquimarina brevivitae]RZS93256.1 FecR family protein [Aquimarina brevivitae]